MTKDEQTIEQYQALSRVQPLNDRESIELERAIRRVHGSKGQKPWKPEDDEKLIKAVRQFARKRQRRRKMPDVAEQLGRSVKAVWKRVDKLRKAGRIGYISPPNGTGRYARKSIIADEAREGV